ncbi:type I restriction endonuclease subunit R [Mycoplasma sp. E35C]|uniref:type I restriction endonuclease subunit R n=1 Tax=Mycoplasma sp. E35C TaxID=2801918 RepID=UPI001CA4324B|nr:type I restriction endonuclease subunit R [Mycoplasma sp. E35C]QZX49327.1 type I restriction endonuclease subunit R [Mycoplasma sp. E35C]
MDHKNKGTVLSEYVSIERQDTRYETEADLEKKFIDNLKKEGYEYINIKNEEELVNNLRIQIEKLNNFQFTDQEWKEFFDKEITNTKGNAKDKAYLIQKEYIKSIRLQKDDSIKNIKLIDKNDIFKNKLQVINQYETDQGKRKNRYDVTILVNGFPLVHIELKRRGALEGLREAFNQINRYENESFWSGYGLFEFIQLYVISNGTYTKYYSKSTRITHNNQANNANVANKNKSFDFTIYWADANNKPITDLVDFTQTFFDKKNLLNILTKYCIYTENKELLVMRPYQITAVERIINQIRAASLTHKYGTTSAGGYIWHTTGSGKTLTSFKTAQLASELPDIKKVLFVVDRKDLDYQTMREYDAFEKGAANSNDSTEVLKKQLSDDNAKIIITTIQKLNLFIKNNSHHKIYDEKVVFIFDECHRSQFGEMHTAVTKNFKKYFLFGFTGTPIFNVNASSNNSVVLKTTEQAFGKQLHVYSIIDAVSDNKVLPFKVEYYSTIKEKDNIQDEKIYGINKEAIYNDSRRIEKITNHILKNFDMKTYRNKNQWFTHNVVDNISEALRTNKVVKKAKKLNGFNSILATASVEAASLYYAEFKKQQANLPINDRLKVALIYSYGENKTINQEVIEDENLNDYNKLNNSQRDFLANAIKDYNEMFQTNFSLDNGGFENYYRDLSLRTKNREIDILIVVNMFLTGFDAPTLNTLWVDKNLQMHGLLQAFSRTNRILNSIKNFGLIVCFRAIKNKVDESIALFANKEASGKLLIRSFAEYYEGYYDDNGKFKKGYKELINELIKTFPLTNRILVENSQQKDFIKLFGQVLRTRNILRSFDEFDAQKQIISSVDFQDYNSMYLEHREKRQNKEAENVNDDVVFEVDIIESETFDIDHILMLVKKYQTAHDSAKKEILDQIMRWVNASPILRSKKELIRAFVDVRLEKDDDIYYKWDDFVEIKKEEQLDQLIKEENLREDETKKFFEKCLEINELKTKGAEINKILPPLSRFISKNNESRIDKKRKVIQKLQVLFERFQKDW